MVKSNLEEVGLSNHLLGSADPGKSPISEPAFSKFSKLVYSLNHITHRISMFILFLMMLLTTLDV